MDNFLINYKLVTWHGGLVRKEDKCIYEYNSSLKGGNRR